MLAYPELPKAKVQDLTEMVQPIERYFDEQCKSMECRLNMLIYLYLSLIILTRLK